MAASTIFYSITRGAVDLTRKVIELDAAMVNLQRVMDLPEYKFNEMLEKSIDNVENLSGKLGDYLNLVAEFGRMGYNDVETLDMSNTAQMLTNISDLTADESVSSLVAAMTAFNIVAEDSVDIADKLNEVDNKYSITTKDLAQSMNKSASTAKVFGASLEELLGFTTAIGSATRESGNVVGNGLKTIMSRIMTLPRAATALNAVGISITDMEGQVRPVADVIDELGKKWNTLSKEEQQNTAIKVAGTNQLSRFNALMLNYGVAVDATTTAMNSQGSATREQEKYNKSLEARINRLSTAWYSLANSVGESILYDGIVVFTSAMEGATKAGDSAVASIGALPIIFGIVGASVALLSTRFSTWTGTLIASRAASLATTATNGTLSASLLGLAATSTIAQRALMMTGVGAALVAVGIGVSLFTSAISKNIQEQEEFDLYIQKNTDALKNNRQATEQLINQYNDLTEAKANGSWDSEKEKEYLEVQQMLGDAFPALVKSIDSTGQSHIKNKEAIEAEIRATNELIDAQNRSTVENSNKEFEKLNEELSGSWYESFSNYVTGSLESRIKQQKNILEAMRESNADDGSIAEQELKLKQLERQFQQTSEEIKGHIFDVANAMSDIDISSNLSNMLQEFVGGLDLSKLDSSELESFSKEIGSIQEGLQRAMNTGDEGSFDSTIAKLNKLASETNGFDQSYGSLSATLEDGNIALKDGSEIIRVLTEDSEDATGSVNELSEAFDEYIASLKELTSVEEQLAGVSQKQVDQVSDLIFLYNSLSSQTSLTTNQSLLLKDAQEKLAELYPHLVENGKVRIDMIEAERKAQEVLLKMVEASKNGQLTSEEEKTLGQLLATNARITNINTEIKAVEALANAYSGVYEATKQAAENGDEDAARALMRMSVPITKYNSLQAELATATANTTNLNREASYAVDRVENSTEKSTSSQKDANKETKNSIYYSDKFASALERINLALEKEENFRSKYATYSKQYQDSLRKESVLLQQKLKLIQDQAKATEKQIKSGKIAPKGMVSTSSSTSSSGKGAYSGKYSTEINRAATTYNIDPHLIAAVIQAESSFNPNAKSGAGARGLMQLMPATAKELGVKDSYNVEQNIMGGVKYLAQQLKTFGGDLQKALAAYNAGAGNVRKYGGIPPFAETQNYVKKIMAEYGTGLATATATVTKQLSGWSGTITGKMGDSRANGTRKHNGIDIAQPNGTRVDANVGGKVIASGDAKSQGYDSSYGNLVVVQGADGAKHFYAHLEKTIAKLGSTIEAGAQLGTVGSTGSSTGNHLHYGVQKNGSFVDPTQYVNNARNGTITTSSSSSNAAAETAQAIDQAKSDLLSLQADALAVQEAIEQLEVELINSQLSGFDKRIDNYQKVIDAETAKTDTLDLASKRYQASLQRQYEFMGYQKKVQEEELAYINKLIRSGSLSNKVKDEMVDKAKELTIAIQSLDVELKNITFEKIMVTMTMFNEAIDDTQYALDKSNAILGKLEEGSAEYTNEMKKQVPLLETQRQQLIDQRDSLVRSLKIHKLTAEQVKKIKEQIEDLNLSIWNTEGAIVDANKALEDMHKNEIIETMTKQQEDHIEALRKKYEDLNNALEKLFSKKEVFDFGVFKDSFDEILYDLNKLDGVLASNPLFSESTNSNRFNLSQLRNEITKVSDEILKMTRATSESDVVLEKMIRNQIAYANVLFDEIEAVENSIRDRQLEQRKIEDSLQNQIDLKREQIEQLDEQYEKEDRLKQIQDVNDEMDKVRNDERFSYIDSSGKEILTYDKNRMKELQLQKDEMLKQFNREDVKAAMNAEITRLEEKLNKTREIHAAEIRILELQRDVLSNLYDSIVADTNEKMEKLETIQNEHVEAVTKSWEKIIEAVTNGTIGFDTLMTEFYGKTMKDLGNYVTGVVEQIATIKSAYASLASLSASAPSTPSTGGSTNKPSGNPLGMSEKDFDRYVWNKERYVNNTNSKEAVAENIRLRDRYGITQDNLSLDELKKYHDGGIVGKTGGSRLAELTNKLFNTKPNEQIVKSLVGELQVPPHNIPNLFTNINSMLSNILPKQSAMQPAGDTIILQGVVIKADNPKQFFNDLDMHIRMNKS